MRYRLSDVCTLIGGGTPKTTVKEYWGGDIPWLSVKDFNNGEKYVYQTEKHITEEGLLNSATTLLQPDDIILSARGTVGEMAVIPFPMAFNQSCYGVRAKKDIITSDYLYYLLKQKVGELKHNAHGSVFDTITRDTFAGIEIELPNIQRQKRVSKILSSFDAKIEMNTRINHNLQQQIQALFSAWFCTFEPFGGTVPSNWSTRNLSEIAEFVGGYAYKGNELMKSTTVMATIKNFERTGGFKLDGFKEIRPSNKLKSTQRLALYDILVAHTDLTQNAEVIGNAEMVMSLLDYHDAIFSMDLVKVVPKPGCLSQFLLAALLQNRVFKAHCLGYVNGTTVLHLSKKALPEYKLLLPNDLSVLSPLDKAITALYLQISANIEENSRLELLRETLLPQLMSGEIDVSNIKL